MAYLTTAPIPWDRVAALQRWVSHGPPAPASGRQAGGCGAVVTFIGVVRADQDGRHVVQALFYEAYPEMAEALIHRLVNEAKVQWTLDGVQIQHRLGLVEVGQISVVVVVAAQHRAQAYAASQFLIDRIKRDAPIWKRGLYDDGTSQRIVDAPEPLDVAPACHEVCGAGRDRSGADHAHV